MSELKLGAQLFTVREYLKTPGDVEKTLKRVKDIGYNSVQLSGMGPIEPERLAQILEENSLIAAATHIGYDEIVNNAETVIKNHKLWNCKYVGLGGLPEEFRADKAGYIRFANSLVPAMKAFRENGLQFVYHNHSFEFEKKGEQTGLEILFDNTDKDLFQFEIDTFWVQMGGADPAAWIEKVNGRMHVVHFKDFQVLEGNQTMAEVGEGNLNWDRIVKACRDTEVIWCLVEQDYCPNGDPFESLEISLRNLEKMGLSAEI